MRLVWLVLGAAIFGWMVMAHVASNNIHDAELLVVTGAASSSVGVVDVELALSSLGVQIIDDPLDHDVDIGVVAGRHGGFAHPDNPSLAVAAQCKLMRYLLMASPQSAAFPSPGCSGGALTASRHYSRDFMFEVTAADSKGGVVAAGDTLLSKIVRWRHAGDGDGCTSVAPLLRRKVLCMLSIDHQSKLDGVAEARTHWMDAVCDHVVQFGRSPLPNGTSPNDVRCYARAADHGSRRLRQWGVGAGERGGQGRGSGPHLGRVGAAPPTPGFSLCERDLPDYLEVHSIGEGDKKDTSYPSLMSALGFVASVLEDDSTKRASSASTATMYDYVVVVQPGTVVVPENLKALLHDPYVDALHMLEAPLLLGHRMVTKDHVPFHAQAIFIINRHLLQSLQAGIGDIECFAQHFAGSHDLFLSRCAGGLMGAYPLSTEDAIGQERIHPLDVDVLNNAGKGLDWFESYHLGRAKLKAGMSAVSRYTAVISNVPAARVPSIHRLIAKELPIHKEAVKPSP